MHDIIDQFFSYLRGIWRHRWYALLVAWLVCLGGWALVYKLPDQYQASAQVYVDTQTMLRPLLKGLAVDINPDSQIVLMTQTLLSRPNLEKVTRMTDLDLKAKDSNAMDTLVANLADRIRLQAAGRVNLYNISFTDHDPQLAKRVVQALLTIFVENTLGETRQDTDTAQRFLERQITEYETRLVSAEERLKEFKLKNMGLMPSDGRDYYQRLQEAQTVLESSRLALRQANNRREALQRQLSGEEPSFGLGPPPPPAPATGNAPADPAITLPVDERIARMQERLDSLLLQFTDQHPDVIITRQLLKDLNAQRQKDLAQAKAALPPPPPPAAAAAGDATLAALSLDTNPVYQQLRIALVQEEAAIAALEEEVKVREQTAKNLEKLVHTVPEIEAQLKALNRDYDVTRQNYETLLARRESAHLSQQVGQTTNDIRFRVIDPPRVPAEPSGPNRPQLMSMVLGLGLIAGIAVAFGLAQLRPTFDSRRSLMQVTNIPVLGSVEAVLSPDKIRRQRIEMVVYLTLGACLMMVFASLLVMQVTANFRIL